MIRVFMGLTAINKNNLSARHPISGTADVNVQRSLNDKGKLDGIVEARKRNFAPATPFMKSKIEAILLISDFFVPRTYHIFTSCFLSVQYIIFSAKNQAKHQKKYRVDT